MDLKYSTIMFDFDGTVLDSGPGILKCAKATMNEFGFTIPELNVLHSFIGPPLKRSFMDTLHIGAEQADRMVDSYRIRYAESKGMFDALMYDGMRELLEELSASKATVAIASAKNEHIVRETLGHFDMLKYFKAVAGSVYSQEYTDKIAITKDCLSRLGVAPEDAILVGDTSYDADAAKAIGIDFCAVTWGYGFKSIEDLKQHKCRYIAEDVCLLKRFLLG